MMIIGDWLIERTVYNNIKKNLNYSEATLIEKLRETDEDLPQKNYAISSGFFPVINQSVFDSLKLDYPLIAGIPKTNTYFCNEGYGLVKYYSDKFGFRNDDLIWEKTNLKIMIGDSFVHGACVSNNDTLPKQLSIALNQQVLNLGMSGNHPGHYLTYGKLFIPKLKPTEVFLVFYANDNGFHQKSEIENKYIIEEKKLFSDTTIELFDIDIFKKEGLKAISIINDREKSSKNQQSKEKKILRKATNAISKHAHLPQIQKILLQISNGFNITEQSIRSIKDLCKENKCEVIVSFIPNSNFFRPDSRADIYGNKISKLCKLLGIKFIDGRNFLDRNKGSEDYAIKGPHLSPLGYKKMASAISSYLLLVE